jgi:hypothetical protein
LGTGYAEGGVGAWVAEVPGELDAGGFDLERGEGGSGVTGGGPEMLGFDCEGGEEDGERGERKVFDAPEARGFRAAAENETDEEDEVSEGEEGEGYPEIEEEMVVERRAVSAGVGGKEPGWGEQERGVVCEARLAGVGHGLRIARSVSVSGGANESDGKSKDRRKDERQRQNPRQKQQQSKDNSRFLRFATE